MDEDDSTHVPPATSMMIRNALGELIGRGMTVDRCDHFKVGGRVLATNANRHPLTPVLVRWPGLDVEWCSPELLGPRSADSERTEA